MFFTKLPRVLAGLLLAGLLVAACAEPDRNDSGSAQGGDTTAPTALPGDPTVTKPAEPAGEVTVTGRVDRDLLSTCQQGEPLVVASIEPAR